MIKRYQYWFRDVTTGYDDRAWDDRVPDSFAFWAIHVCLAFFVAFAVCAVGAVGSLSV